MGSSIAYQGQIGTIAALFAAISCALAAAPAIAGPFDALQEELWPSAQQAGISRPVFDAAFAGLTPDPDVLELASHQPEFTLSPAQYMSLLVTPKRLGDGKELLQQNKKMFAAIERRYGVSRYILTAIWGIESNYGAEQGTKNVIRSLATLAASGKRTEFAKTQLIAALKILQHGDVKAKDMVGSWAGAMGHTQFIPTTYDKFAVDFSGRGKRDIWTTPADALGSSAHYLKRSGWRAGAAWGYEVTLPQGFDTRLASETVCKRARQWQKLGVMRVNSRPFPRSRESGYLFLPAGIGGPAFFVTGNFSVIKKYNSADLYALAVGHLADRLAGGEPLAKAWP
jgi:membrane-bound lytic murein transglycosylase B